MSVKIRMKKMGRRHRAFFRVCAMDSRSPRDGRVLEELGTYDPMIRDVNGRAILKSERIDYWLSVGAQPSDKVGVLIKKYGTNGTHLEQQGTALAQLAVKQAIPEREAPVFVPKPEESAAEAAPSEAEAPAEAKPAEAKTDEAAATEAAPTEAAAEEKPVTEEAPAEEKPAE